MTRVTDGVGLTRTARPRLARALRPAAARTPSPTLSTKVTLARSTRTSPRPRSASEDRAARRLGALSSVSLTAESDNRGGRMVEYPDGERTVAA